MKVRSVACVIEHYNELWSGIVIRSDSEGVEPERSGKER